MPYSTEGDRGLTLVEILVTIAIMGTAVVAVLGLYQANIGFSTRHRAQANVQAVLVSSADHLTKPDIQLIPCDPGRDDGGEPAIRKKYEEEVLREGTLPEFDESLIRIKGPILFWDSVAQEFEEVTATNRCSALDARADQLVTIQVLASPNAQLDAQLEVVKSDA
jgi:prepilin-type N-terminal cleavage/methylation domain-containing protein